MHSGRAAKAVLTQQVRSTTVLLAQGTVAVIAASEHWCLFVSGTVRSPGGRKGATAHCCTYQILAPGFPQYMLLLLFLLSGAALHGCALHMGMVSSNWLQSSCTEDCGCESPQVISGCLLTKALVCTGTSGCACNPTCSYQLHHRTAATPHMLSRPC
jgi:hypothetical protein